MDDRVECAPRQSPIKARARARDGAINDKTILSVRWSLNRTLPWGVFSLSSSVVSLPATANTPYRLISHTHKGVRHGFRRGPGGERERPIGRVRELEA